MKNCVFALGLPDVDYLKINLQHLLQLIIQEMLSSKGDGGVIEAMCAKY
jgi:hypothetical protein